MASPPTAPHRRPFIYIANLTELSNGSEYQNVQVPLQRDYPFTLHRVAGIGSMAGYFTLGFGYGLRVYNANQQPLGTRISRNLNDWPYVPGVEYPADSQIKFDTGLLTKDIVLGSVGSVDLTQLAFQGVKNIYGDLPRTQTPYPYYEKLQVYAQTVDLWTAAESPAFTIPQRARDFAQNVESRDFELLYIVLLISIDGDDYVPSNGKVALELFDPLVFPLQSGPVNDRYINYLNTDYNCGWPNPTVVYPANSIIRFKLTSLLTNDEQPATLRIEFHGVNRMPYEPGQSVVERPNVAGWPTPGYPRRYNR